MLLILPQSKVRRTEDVKQELVVSHSMGFLKVPGARYINLKAFAFLCLRLLLASALGNSGKANRVEQ